MEEECATESLGNVEISRQSEITILVKFFSTDGKITFKV